MKCARDHLGNEYRSVQEMCNTYGVHQSTYNYRIKIGCTVEEALIDEVHMKRILQKEEKDSIYTVYDHIGNKFNSITEMCKAYDVKVNTFYVRRERGFTLEESLTGTREVRKSVEDHLGNKYTSILEMCNKYGVNYSTYSNRKRSGWSMEEALSPEVYHKYNSPKSDERYTVSDHLGNKFHTVKEMCETYGVGYVLYLQRLSCGWSVMDALTTDKRAHNIVKDHLGNEFRSVKEMCEYYNLNYNTYETRVKCGWSLERILTTKPDKGRCGIVIMDHLGNKYNSIKEMCQHYSIDVKTFYWRIKNNWLLEKALTHKARRYRKK